MSLILNWFKKVSSISRGTTVTTRPNIDWNDLPPFDNTAKAKLDAFKKRGKKRGKEFKINNTEIKELAVSVYAAADAAVYALLAAMDDTAVTELTDDEIEAKFLYFGYKAKIEDITFTQETIDNYMEIRNQVYKNPGRIRCQSNTHLEIEGVQAYEDQEPHCVVVIDLGYTCAVLKPDSIITGWKGCKFGSGQFVAEA